MYQQGSNEPKIPALTEFILNRMGRVGFIEMVRYEQIDAEGKGNGDLGEDFLGNGRAGGKCSKTGTFLAYMAGEE